MDRPFNGGEGRNGFKAANHWRVLFIIVTADIHKSAIAVVKSDEFQNLEIVEKGNAILVGGNLEAEFLKIRISRGGFFARFLQIAGICGKIYLIKGCNTRTVLGKISFYRSEDDRLITQHRNQFDLDDTIIFYIS